MVTFQLILFVNTYVIHSRPWHSNSSVLIKPHRDPRYLRNLIDPFKRPECIMAIGWHAPNEDFDLADRQFKTSDYDDYENDPCVYRADESGPWLLLQCPAGERCPHCNERPGHYGCVVIAVDGACWNNGTDQAQAAGAVYFHDSNNQCNKSFLVPGTKTSQRAELHAGLEALRLANIIRDFNPVLSKAELLEMRPYDPLTKLHQVVIKADSEYLVCIFREAKSCDNALIMLTAGQGHDYLD